MSIAARNVFFLPMIATIRQTIATTSRPAARRILTKL
jgi:hypothetical protein